MMTSWWAAMLPVCLKIFVAEGLVNYVADKYICMHVCIYCWFAQLGRKFSIDEIYLQLFIHSFIADIYIVPLQVGLLRSAPSPSVAK